MIKYCGPEIVLTTSNHPNHEVTKAAINTHKVNFKFSAVPEVIKGCFFFSIFFLNCENINFARSWQKWQKLFEVKT